MLVHVFLWRYPDYPRLILKIIHLCFVSGMRRRTGACGEDRGPEHLDRGPDTLRPHTPGQPADWNKAWMSLASIPKLFESLKSFHLIFCPCYLTSTFHNGTCSNVDNVVFVSLPFLRPCWWLMCLVLEGCLLVFFWECIWHRIGHWLPKINS